MTTEGRGLTPCEHTEHAVRGDGRYGRSFPRGGPDAGVWERCEPGRGLSLTAEVNEAKRAARPADHGHDEHAPFFDGLIEDCAGCARMTTPARVSSDGGS